jgi:DNA-binding CsgD family transcriptional regulator
VATSSPLRVLLIGVAADDLDRLRRRTAADPMLEIVGATLVGRTVDVSHDAVLLTPAALTQLHRLRQGFGESGRAGGKGEEPPAEALTARELDVLSHVAEGHGNREIGDLLGISEHTVKFHLASIYGKLGVGNRTEAVQHALRMGLIEI